MTAGNVFVLTLKSNFRVENTTLKIEENGTF